MDFSELYFPYDEVRDVQDELILKVDECLNDKKHLIVHAPTGIGKTVSTLGPALKTAIKEDLTILFLTSRHTQHLIAIETIKLIKEKFNLEFHVADIIGKRWMCLQPGASLLYSSEFFEFCKQLRESGKCEYYSNARNSGKMTPKAEKLVEEIGRLSNNDSERIKSLCDDEKMCPYEIAIELAKKAKVIICDYNYAFDPIVKNSLFAKANLEMENCILIIDEGHNIPDRIRNIYTTRLTNVMLKRAIKEGKKFGYEEAVELLAGIQEVLLDMSDNLKIYEDKLISKDDFFVRVNKLKDFKILTDDFEEIADEIREKQRQSYIGGINFFLKSWDGEDEGFIRFISKNQSKNELMITLSYRCLDPSILTSKVLGECYSSILMSGTLTPTSMYKDLLGYPSNTEELTLPSPFPEENKLSLIVPRTTTQFKQRSEKMFEGIAQHCAEIVNNIPGNSAIFFPSYQMMASVYTYLYELIEKTVFKESPELNKNERKEMLEKFGSYKKTGACLLGVASGSFGEGIDLPGDLLKGVVIVGLPLQRPDLETKELINYYDKKYGKGWDYAYVFPAFSKTLQNAGRCIRSGTDRGIIVFLDERYSWPNYFKNFPPEMKLDISVDYTDKIKGFFGLL